MIHFLPAVCLSTFLFSPKYVPSQQLEFVSQANKVSSKKFDILKLPYLTEEAASEIKVANLRVVAVSLTNDTAEPIVLRNKLRIKLDDPFADSVDFTPPALSKKQITSVYFLYNLLRQNLPAAPGLNYFNSNAFKNPEDTYQALEDIFMANIQNINIPDELKEAQLLNKIIAPGQKLSGLIYFYTASSAPIRFYLN